MRTSTANTGLLQAIRAPLSLGSLFLAGVMACAPATPETEQPKSQASAGQFDDTLEAFAIRYLLQRLGEQKGDARDIVSRREWGAEPPKPEHGAYPRFAPRNLAPEGVRVAFNTFPDLEKPGLTESQLLPWGKISLHHAGVGSSLSPDAYLKEIQQLHMAQDSVDVRYHYAVGVERFGDRWRPVFAEGRHKALVGASVLLHNGASPYQLIDRDVEDEKRPSDALVLADSELDFGIVALDDLRDPELGEEALTTYRSAVGELVGIVSFFATRGRSELPVIPHNQHLHEYGQVEQHEEIDGNHRGNQCPGRLVETVESESEHSLSLIDSTKTEVMNWLGEYEDCLYNDGQPLFGAKDYCFDSPLGLWPSVDWLYAQLQGRREVLSCSESVDGARVPADARLFCPADEMRVADAFTLMQSLHFPRREIAQAKAGVHARLSECFDEYFCKTKGACDVAHINHTMSVQEALSLISCAHPLAFAKLLEIENSCWIEQSASHSVSRNRPSRDSDSAVRRDEFACLLQRVST